MRRKGYLTVEASLILSMAVIAAGIMISLCLYVYQRCWYTQTACETVMEGSFLGVLKGNSPLEEAKQKWELRKKDFYPEPEGLQAELEGGKKEIRYKIAGRTPVWGRNFLEFHGEASQKLVRPVSFIRKTAALMEMGE
ncbi:MAG: hypothetical protein KH828_00145 [Clostridiales bacterium]|nr:hypothetical protein [Clostridiales bacterium]